MRLRVLIAALTALIGFGAAPSLAAQEGPAKRLSSIVGVAVEEYGKGIDGDGRLISQDEYDEAVSFLRDAKEVAARLSGARTVSTQAALDSLIAAVIAKRPPRDLDPNHVEPRVLTVYAGLLFRDLLDRCGGDVNTALGAYNGGLRNPNMTYAGGVSAAARHARNVMEHAAVLNGPAVGQQFLRPARALQP